MKTYSYTITKQLTEEEIGYIMDSALGSSGIFYWADEYELQPKHKGQTKTFEYDSQALTNGFNLRIHDAEEEKWHTLTLKKLLKGLSLYHNFNGEDFDGPMCDNLVQIALFGEIVYG